MVTHELRPTFARGIEAQSESVEMARRAVTELPPHHGAIEIAHADFRETVDRTGRYELVTGSPPYFPLDAGVLPADPQKCACRFEVRGGVESYIEAAARVMSANGRFYLVFQSRWTSRVLDAADAQGLRLGGRADFWAKAGDDLPFLSVFELSRRPADVPHHFACTVREADGSISPAYQRVREELGVAAVSG